MSIFRNYKDDIIKDQMETIKRLNEELSMRIKYEEQLLYVIGQLEKYEDEGNQRERFESLNKLLYKDSEKLNNIKENMYAERQRGFEEFMKLDESEKDK
jgi:hypothetical protein